MFFTLGTSVSNGIVCLFLRLNYIFQHNGSLEASVNVNTQYRHDININQREAKGMLANTFLFAFRVVSEHHHTCIF